MTLAKRLAWIERMRAELYGVDALGAGVTITYRPTSDKTLAQFHCKAGAVSASGTTPEDAAALLSDSLANMAAAKAADLRKVVAYSSESDS